MATDPVRDPRIDVTGTKTALGGATDRLDRDLAYGERLVLIVDAVVTDVGLRKGPNGPIVARKVTAVDLLELEGDRGRDVLNALRLERRSAEDQASGRGVLPGFEVTTDAAGVLITGAERADLTGDTEREDFLDVQDGDRDDALVLTSLPFLLDDANDAEAVIASLNGISLITPRLLRAAYLAEEANLHRGEVLDAIDERLGRELVRIASEEPWAGYAKASVAAIVSRLDADRPTFGERGTWVDHLEHVHAYEEAHKARRAILDYGQPEPPAPAEPEEPPLPEDDELTLEDGAE